ncbi:hypothetical protein ACJZ2D_017198 [Fusarium nematophilum]
MVTGLAGKEGLRHATTAVLTWRARASFCRPPSVPWVSLRPANDRNRVGPSLAICHSLTAGTYRRGCPGTCLTQDVEAVTSPSDLVDQLGSDQPATGAEIEQNGSDQALRARGLEWVVG